MSNIFTDEKIESLVSEYGTPLYIYDKSVIKNSSAILKDSIYPGSRLFYAMKCNPLVGICSAFREEGLGIETASKGEITAALKAGFKGEDIIFTSPGKTEEEIGFAIENDLKVINIDSLYEAEIVDRIAGGKGKKVKIALRINPSQCYSNAKIKMTGIPSQFGVEEEELDGTFFEKLASFKNIEPVGFQIYMGTQMLKVADIIGNTEYAMNLAIKLSEEYGLELKYLNCGGGFGVKYFKNEEPLDMQELKEQMHSLKDRMGDKLKGVEVIFESGRFLMATAGVMVTKVLYRKDSKGQRFLICDGGSNFHSSAAFLGRFVRNNFPQRAIIHGQTGEKTETTVCGPLCTSLDVMGQKVELDENTDAGDLIVIEQSGAYGYTYSPSLFLSHESPAEILVDGDSVKILRHRGESEDFL
ncbi:MAG: diaminopimelate decarboxylase, partial [Lachnospiraceae bacterium]|nr:diaminopimelate decarboxylase [Lachnospiraceae bacterium]